VAPGSVVHARRLPLVEEAFRTLPERYLGARRGFDATYEVRLADLDRTWEVRCTEAGVEVRDDTDHPSDAVSRREPSAAGLSGRGGEDRGATRDARRRPPDVVIETDAVTWLRLRKGRLSGLDAYRARRLTARGDLDLAVGFEGMFRLPNGRPPLLRIDEVRLPGRRVSVLTMGRGPDVILIHGLGSTKASFFETASALSRTHRVHAIDLPGFGGSSKSPTAPYTARWFAETVCDLLDALGIERAHLVGNSMGGRVALEVGLRRPERVSGLVLLCPAVAFVKRSYQPLVRLLRPELGFVPHHFSRAAVTRQLESLFHDRTAIDPSVADIAVDEFQRIYQSAGARFAFLCAARNIYLDAPFGRNGFYPRLADLDIPALFVWGRHDPLIPPAFARHVEQWLPRAEQVVLEECGHVPQVERAEETNTLIQDFLTRTEARHRQRPRLHAAA
jgi:pimeloyl-ACP methyl ester carboxylesterase